jgi:two-component system chemotaxis response regulator CheY
MRILIVEDDLISRKILAKTVESWGHEVIAAENGLEAWNIFQQEKLKFVIADWVMPEMDGIELCKKIRHTETSGYIYFILLTGKDKKKDVIEGLQAGADDYVAKPFDIDELRVRVRTGERILNLEKELNKKNDEMKLLNEQLEALAMTDPLMEIGNRRAFYETIQKIHQRSCRYPYGYGIIMIDIDNFKNYNDSYGHAEGDNALKTVADSLKNALRCSDEIFRWGGEEIVIILIEQGLQETLLVAEKLRKKIASLQIVHKGCDRGYMTISCGVSAFSENCTDKKWETVLERADNALYEAKETGRNRVCLGEENPDR